MNFDQKISLLKILGDLADDNTTDSEVVKFSAALQTSEVFITRKYAELIKSSIEENMSLALTSSDPFIRKIALSLKEQK
jgi:uncharacterized alpha/beta hydrolase family protein